MKYISWNVNGIRAALNKGFMDFFESTAFDILALQETKCQVMRFRRTGTLGNIHLQLHSAFDPADASANYLADSGSSVAPPPASTRRISTCSRAILKLSITPRGSLKRSNRET